MSYENLDPIFSVSLHKTRVIIPFEVIHIQSNLIITQGTATFENGKAIVLTDMEWQAVTGPIRSVGTLDHVIHWIATNEGYTFRWCPVDTIRIEE